MENRDSMNFSFVNTSIRLPIYRRYRRKLFFHEKNLHQGPLKFKNLLPIFFKSTEAFEMQSAEYGNNNIDTLIRAAHHLKPVDVSISFNVTIGFFYVKDLRSLYGRCFWYSLSRKQLHATRSCY